MLQIDHITVAADGLRAGVAHAEAALGVTIPFCGAHPLMGTHNHLLRLGDTLFLEIIAPDPAAGPLSQRRWFGLDDAKQRAELAVSPRLATWIVATDDIEASLRQVAQYADMANFDALNAGVIDQIKRLCERGAAEGVMRKDIDPVDLHMTISALCFFNVSNRYTFSRIFRLNMGSKAALKARRESVADLVVRSVAV